MEVGASGLITQLVLDHARGEFVTEKEHALTHHHKMEETNVMGHRKHTGKYVTAMWSVIGLNHLFVSNSANK